MITKHSSTTVTRAIVLALAALPSALHAQAYPAKPIGIIVPFAPGGVADVVGRTVTPQLAEALGQQERLSSQGAEPVGSTPEQFDAFLRSEVAKRGKVIRVAKVPAVE